MRSTVKAFLVGPTGVGKTAVAILAGRSLGAEILGVDSRQIYRRLQIATAKPTAAERRKVRHHLIDLLDPRQRCSAGRFLRLFRAAVEELAGRGVPGLAVGGAGLYVDACLGRLHPLPEANEALRARLLALEAREGPGSLHRRLQQLDPPTAARLSPRDLQRIVRALEVAELTGEPLSRHLAGQPEAACPPSTPVIHLTRPRRELYDRIERRCHAMVAAGLAEEVRSLLASGLERTAPGMKTLGYSEWVGWALGLCDREEAMETFVRNSRRYAKRQETWFRNRHPDRHEILIAPGETNQQVAARVLERLGA